MAETTLGGAPPASGSPTRCGPRNPTQTRAPGWWTPTAGAPLKIGSEPTRLVWSRDGGMLWQLRRAGDQIELWEAETGVWSWRRRSILDLGRPAVSHLEHLPLTVNPATGELIMNRRTSLASLLVFENVDPARW